MLNDFNTLQMELCSFILDADHVSETDSEVVAKISTRGKGRSKLDPPPSSISTDDTDLDTDANKENNNEGGIKFNPGKTSRWHRPKRKRGITNHHISVPNCFIPLT